MRSSAGRVLRDALRHVIALIGPQRLQQPPGGSVAEWSKALDLGSSHFDGVGSNPTAATPRRLLFSTCRGRSLQAPLPFPLPEAFSPFFLWDRRRRGHCSAGPVPPWPGTRTKRPCCPKIKQPVSPESVWDASGSPPRPACACGLMLRGLGPQGAGPATSQGQTAGGGAGASGGPAHSWGVSTLRSQPH